MRFNGGLRRFAACAALLTAGVFAAVAAGPGVGAITVPTITVPTLPVSTPTVTVPATPPPPVLPPPPVSVPRLTPPPPPPPPPAGSPPPRSGGSGSPSSSPSGTAASTPSHASGSGASSGGGGFWSGSTGHATAIRRHVKLDAHHKTSTLAFRLRRGGVVHVVVTRPGCGFVTSFPVRAHKGVNSIRVRRRLHGTRLPTGTYRIRGRSHGHIVLRATLVVGSGRNAPCPSASQAAAFTGLLGGTAVKGAGGSLGSPAASGGSASGTTGSSDSDSGKLAAGKSGAPIVREPRSGGVLGATASKVLPGSGGTQLGLLIVLTAAIFLLALGAVPREVVPHPAAAAFLARRRAMIAVAGLTALGAFLISYFIA